MTAHLILNGPFRSHIWLHDPNASCFVPFNETAYLHYTDSTDIATADTNTTFTFAAWYEHWLDHALEQISAEYEDEA